METAKVGALVSGHVEVAHVGMGGGWEGV